MINIHCLRSNIPTMSIFSNNGIFDKQIIRNRYYHFPPPNTLVKYVTSGNGTELRSHIPFPQFPVQRVWDTPEYQSTSEPRYTAFYKANTHQCPSPQTRTEPGQEPFIVVAESPWDFHTSYGHIVANATGTIFQRKIRIIYACVARTCSRKSLNVKSDREAASLRWDFQWTFSTYLQC